MAHCVWLTWKIVSIIRFIELCVTLCANYCTVDVLSNITLLIILHRRCAEQHFVTIILYSRCVEQHYITIILHSKFVEQHYITIILHSGCTILSNIYINGKFYTVDVSLRNITVHYYLNNIYITSLLSRVFSTIILPLPE